MTGQTSDQPADLEGDLAPYQCHCLVARQLARHVSRIYDRRMAPAGISAGDLAVLEFVSRAGGLAVTDLAAAMLLERTTLLRNLKPLIDAGYLTTARDPAHPRRHVVSITPIGENKKREAHGLWQAAQDEFETEAGQDAARTQRRQILEALGVI